MSNAPLAVQRTRHRFLPDARRVITKPFLPGEEIFPDGRSRVRIVLDRVLAIPESEVAAELDSVIAAFAERHHEFEAILQRNFQLVERYLPDPAQLSPQRQLLIGAYYTHEYSIEAAALANPSIVPAPNATIAPEDPVPFVMSLRAIGEGHISSIEFRTGVARADGGLEFDEATSFVAPGEHIPNPSYQKRIVALKLQDLRVFNEIARRILKPLADEFTLDDLMHSIETASRDHVYPEMARETIKTIHWLATSNYEITFPPESALSERVIFPAGPTESRGMEDARFVRFREDDGSIRYFATYTAFDGNRILPQLIETRDFVTFRIRTLNGAGLRNKGMALFPRRIGGRFAMLARQDGETLFFMTSDDINFWQDADRIGAPRRPWELIQIGNCGSPIETEEGWLVLTHGVGPMRQYSIGAMLLDLEDPRRVVSSLPEPFLRPADDERDGYVPNVVYTCGALAHHGRLTIPYGFSDIGVHIASLSLDDLLMKLNDGRH